MKQARHISLIFALILFSAPMFCQILYPLDKQRADSLNELLPFLAGNEKVNALNTMSRSLLRHYSRQSDSLAGKALALAEETDYREGIAMGHFLKGTNGYFYGDFIGGLNNLYEALEIFLEMKDTSMIIDTYFQIAIIIYFSLTDDAEAIRLANQCLHYSKSSGNWMKTAQMYSSLQYIYGMQGNSQRAQEYLARYDSVVDGRQVHWAETAMITGAWGRTYAQQGKYRKAIRKYLEAVSMINPDDIEERAYLSQMYTRLGDIYMDMNKPDSALYHYQAGQAFSWRYKHHFGSIINLFGLARLSLINGQLDLSKKYIDSVLFYGRKIDSSASLYGIPEYGKLLGISGEIYLPANQEFKRYLAWNLMIGAYRMLIQIHEVNQEFKDAYFTWRAYEAVKDSVAKFQKQKELLEIQYKYQTVQKDDQIRLLSQANELQQYRISQNRIVLIGGAAFVFLASLVLLLFIRQSRLRSTEQLTEFKQKLFRSQMNPHFIFNSLTSIQNFIVNQDDIKASIYLSRFSELVRSILHNSQVERITLEQEISTIENYLELQKVRFSDRFDFQVEIDKKIDVENTYLPPMLGQPFIENAIEHGIRHLETKGHIQVRFLSRDGQLLYIVEDNGVGRKRAQEILRAQNKEHKSMATAITAERIRVLNRKRKSKISLDIDDLFYPNGLPSGTRVTFTVSLQGRPATV